MDVGIHSRSDGSLTAGETEDDCLLEVSREGIVTPGRGLVIRSDDAGWHLSSPHVPTVMVVTPDSQIRLSRDEPSVWLYPVVQRLQQGAAAVDLRGL